MNNFGEHYPGDFSSLLQKCDETVSFIKSAFAKGSVTVVKDLYITGTKLKRSEDYYSKLNVEPGKNKEVKGLYIFAELDDNKKYIPIYVGISRSVFRRLYQHAFGKNHNQASFCYLKAKHFYEHPIDSRIDLPWQFVEAQQQKLREYSVIIIQEKEDYDLYFMEVYIAGKLKTKWNSFKTH